MAAGTHDIRSEDEFEIERINGDLYRALKDGKKWKVVEYCRDSKDGALHVLTINNDTILHMATMERQADLIFELLGLVKKEDYPKLIFQNAAGNTILHEAAASNMLVPVAKKMLLMCPELLIISNNSNQKPLFRAAYNGKSDMFEFLDKQASEKYLSELERKPVFYQINNKTTILHKAIVSGKFGLALTIADKYPSLIGEEDEFGMTALQYLACNSSLASSTKRRGLLKSFLQPFVSTHGPFWGDAKKERGWMVPLVEDIREEIFNYIAAMKLVEVLAKRDISWKKTKPVVESSYALDTPLFIATKAGSVDIVFKILKLYPQAIEHIDGNGCTILHIAVKYHQIHILMHLEEKMGFSIRNFITKCDNYGNSILHMVAYNQNDKKQIEDEVSPALQLRENLLLYEHLEKLCQGRLSNHVNYDGQTAEELFATRNAKLFTDAKELVKTTAENCSVIVVLIASVAFTAAYTLPGGLNSQTGVPVLLNEPFFITFTITNILALACSLTSLLIWVKILVKPFALKDFRQSLPGRLMMGFTFLIISISMMMLAFSSTSILMIHNKNHTIKNGLYAVAVLIIAIFAFSYMPLYIAVLATSKYMFIQIKPILPRYKGFPLWSRPQFKVPKITANKIPNFTFPNFFGRGNINNV